VIETETLSDNQVAKVILATFAFGEGKGIKLLIWMLDRPDELIVIGRNVLTSFQMSLLARNLLLPIPRHLNQDKRY